MMLKVVRSALMRRQKAVVVAEALVWRHGARGVQMARHAANNPHQDEKDRRFWQSVARIAARRFDQVDGLDTASAYEIGNRWAQRRESLMQTAPRAPYALP